MRLIPSKPLSCLGTAVVAVVVGGVVLVGCDVVELDELGDFSDFGGVDDIDMNLPGGGADPDASASPEDEEGEASAYGVPASCDAAGAATAVGDLAPGPALTESLTEVEGIEGAEQLMCSYSDGSTEPGTPTFTLVYTVNVDPSANPDVVQVPGAEAEMNWEVDVDVDVDTYHNDDTDELGGDLEYVGTVDGSSRQLFLSLPGDFHVAAIAFGEDVAREDLERVVMTAAESVRN